MLLALEIIGRRERGTIAAIILIIWFPTNFTNMEITMWNLVIVSQKYCKSPCFYEVLPSLNVRSIGPWFVLNKAYLFISVYRY